MTVSNYAGLLSLAMAILGVVLGAIYIGKNTASKEAGDAQGRAIAALQSELQTMRSKVDDLKEENKLQGHIMETIFSALESKGIIITIMGEMVTIQDGSGSSSVMKIRNMQQKLKKEN